MQPAQSHATRPRTVSLPWYVQVCAAVIAGLGVAGAFPDLNQWWLAPLGLGLIAMVTTGVSARRAALLGWLMGLAHFLPTYTWANASVGAVPWVLLSAAVAAFSAIALASWAMVVRQPWLAQRRWLWAPVFATLWCGAELLRSVWPFGGMPWGAVAFSQSSSPLGRFVWLGGTTVVAWLMCLTGVLIWLALTWPWWQGATSWESVSPQPRTAVDGDSMKPAQATRVGAPRDSITRTSDRRISLVQRGVMIGSAGAIVGIGYLIPVGTTYGHAPTSDDAAAGSASGETLRVGVVQGNVSGIGLHAFENRREVLDNHVAGTNELVDQVGKGALDLIVWPENSTDLSPYHYPEAADAIEAAAQYAGTAILVGTDRYPAQGVRYNLGVLWEPGQGIVATYAKQHPVPFAEYIPLRDIARRVSAAVDLVQTDLQAGTETGLLPLEVARLGRTVTIGDVICFEIAIDPLVRTTVAEGAEILIVQTNNANFGNTAESTQQLAMTKLRAMETGRATVQSSTVGVSGAFLPDGTQVAGTGLFTHEVFAVDLPLQSGWTPAVRIGAMVSWLVAGASGALVIAGIGLWGRSRLTTTRPQHAAPRSDTNDGRS